MSEQQLSPIDWEELRHVVELIKLSNGEPTAYSNGVLHQINELAPPRYLDAFIWRLHLLGWEIKNQVSDYWHDAVSRQVQRKADKRYDEWKNGNRPRKTKPFKRVDPPWGSPF